MKKIIVAILAIIYMGTSTGATIHMHYCMGKLVSTDILPVKNDKCGTCGMKKTEGKSNGCCKDEHKQVKIDKDQKATHIAVQTMESAAVEMPAAVIEIPFHNFSSLTEKNPYGNAPPRSVAVAVYIRNCVFLI